MQLRRLVVENLRGYARRTELELGDMTAVVGRNDVGKSTLLEALEIFFNNSTVKIDQQDPHVLRRHEPVQIHCIFDEFPTELVIDARSSTTLSDEHLLNRDGLLQIVKSFDCSGKSIKTTVSAMALHPTAAGADDLLQLKSTELKARAEQLGVNLDGVDRRSNVQLRGAIRSHIGELELAERMVPLTSEGSAKEVWEQIERVLPTFALFQSDRPSRDDDREVQDPMKLAITEAVKAVEEELDGIKEKVRERAIAVADRTLTKLQELDPRLATELRPEFKAEPKWDGFKLTLSGDSGIPINKRGSGVRRLILLSFFRAEAERLREESPGRRVIYAVEEPENSQHPNNQAMLIRALIELGQREGTQVILTTHVPGVAGLLPEDCLRLVRRDADGYPVVVPRDEVQSFLSHVADELGVLPEGRVQVLVHVEGPNDVAFLCAMSRLLRSDDPTVLDLENDPRVAFVLTGGGNLKHWVNRRYLAGLGLREVHIYDRDAEEPPAYATAVAQVNESGGGNWACLTNKRMAENYLHPLAVEAAMGVQVEFGDHCDVPAIVAKAVHEASPDATKPWGELTDNQRRQKVSQAKRRLNEQVAGAMTLVQLLERDPHNEVRSWFDQIAFGLRDWAPPAQEARVEHQQIVAAE